MCRNLFGLISMGRVEVFEDLRVFPTVDHSAIRVAGLLVSWVSAFKILSISELSCSKELALHKNVLI